MADATLDARGLRCPLPVLRARKAMQQLAPGQVLLLIATDPGTRADVEAFCAATGHELLDSQAAGGEFTYQIRKASGR